MQRLALHRSVQPWSLKTLREKLVKIGAKAVGHAWQVMFQPAEVAAPLELFATILGRIELLPSRSPLAGTG